MDKVNFTGGFLISRPSEIKWQNVEKFLPERRFLLKDFNTNGDVFVAAKESLDKQMIAMLLKKRVKFSFFPSLSIDSFNGVTSKRMAKKIVKAQNDIVSGKLSMKKMIANEKFPFSSLKYKWQPNDHISQTMKALGLDENKYNAVIKDGITTIRAKDGKKIAIASPNSQLGFNYVYVLPEIKGGSPRRLVVNSNGEIERELSVLDIDVFNKHFRSAVKNDKGRIRK